MVRGKANDVRQAEGGASQLGRRPRESGPDAAAEASPAGLSVPMALGQEAAMRRMIEQTAMVLRDMAEGFDNLGDSVGRHSALPEAGHSPRMSAYTVEFLTDPVEIAAALLDAAAVATNLIISMHPGPVAKRAELDEELERTGHALSRGVAVRSIYAESFLKHRIIRDHDHIARRSRIALTSSNPLKYY